MKLVSLTPCLYLALCLSPYSYDTGTPAAADLAPPMLQFTAPAAGIQPLATSSATDSPSEIIIEDNPQSGNTRAFDIFEYLDLSALAGGSSGSSLSRRFSYSRIGGQYSNGRVSVKGNYLITRVASDLELVLSEDAAAERQRCLTDEEFLAISNSCPDLLDAVEEIDFKFRYRESGLDELYTQVLLRDNLNLTVGKNRITWGQFAYLSPVHVLLPINTDQQIGFSKVDSRQPQPIIQLQYYPYEPLLVELTYIAQTELSPETERFFDLSYRGDPDDEDDDFETRYAPGYNSSRNAAEQFATHEHIALRVLYQPAWGVVGLTYWRGPSSFDVPDNATVYCSNFSRHYCGLAGEPSPGEPPSYAGDYFRTVAPDLNRTSALGLEVSYHLKNWVLIGEWAHIREQTNSLDTASALNTALQVCGNPGHVDLECEQERQLGLRFLDVLARNNSGSNNFPSRFDLFAFGGDGSSSDGSWIYNLEILGIRFGDEGYDAFSGLDLSFDEDLAEDLQAESTNSFFLPTFHVANSHTFTGKPANWGVLFGFFLQFAGILSYYNVDVHENVSVQVALEFIQRATEEGAALDDYVDYDLKDEAAQAISTTVQIKF